MLMLRSPCWARSGAWAHSLHDLCPDRRPGSIRSEILAHLPGHLPCPAARRAPEFNG
jgi:hypothetical protein